MINNLQNLLKGINSIKGYEEKNKVTTTINYDNFKKEEKIDLKSNKHLIKIYCNDILLYIQDINNSIASYYEYDDNSNISQIIKYDEYNSDTITTRYKYDKYNRIVKRTYYVNNNPITKIKYKYDDYDNCIEEKIKNYIENTIETKLMIYNEYNERITIFEI